MQTVDTAKQFLLTRVVEQATTDNVSLSDIEKRMFLFSEVSQNPPDWDANEKFESEYDSGDYEKKITKLLRVAYGHDKKDPAKLETWTQSLKALAKEDFYGLVMVDQAKIPRPKKAYSGLGTFLNATDLTFAILELLILGLAFVLLLGLVRFPVLSSDIARLVSFALLLAAAWWVGRFFGRYQIGKAANRLKGQRRSIGE
jgi:hypothetical protein